MNTRIEHRFVRAVPERLDAGVLYLSLDYVTTSHLCACGCGAEVVLPLHPTKWRMSFDGSTVSMSPSIGSRTLPCRSHYFITNGRIVWAKRMTADEFDGALARDLRDDDRWHGRKTQPALASDDVRETDTVPPVSHMADRLGFLGRMRRWISSRTH